MANKYDINQFHLLVSQKKLKQHLKAGDSIFLDQAYLQTTEATLKKEGIPHTIFPLAVGFQIIIEKVPVKY